MDRPIWRSALGWALGRLAALLVLLALGAVASAGAALAEGITNSGDDLRDGWYPEQSALTPQLVSGGTFGALWSTPVDGQVYAQPLLANGNVLVVTENDKVYALDPATGALRWPALALVGTPWKGTDIGCGDITPNVGVTSTPVVDTTTNTAYLTHKAYASGSSGPARWYMDAIDLTKGTEKAGFPVELSGAAQNLPAMTFEPTHQMQRPGLLLMNGVIYAGFGSQCDVGPWQGWIFAVSTSGATKARWVSVPKGWGGGIWQSGSGLVSDGPGSLMFATGNLGAPTTPAPGNAPPTSLAESIVRLAVQPDGTLKAVNFFAPYNAKELDEHDLDFASSGVTALNDQYFGTLSFPHLMVAAGKQGYVYLLNREELGGFQQGLSGGDKVLQRIGPYGGVWARPAVWPGDGGWIYIPTSYNGGALRVYQYGVSGSGQPTISLQATSSDSFGFSSSSAVVTSNGTKTGSALVWIIWTSGSGGTGAQLRAYDPVPVEGKPVLRWSAPIGTSTRFGMPGVGANRIYVGTRDEKVLAFGSPVTAPLTGPATEFPITTVGASSEKTLTLTANSSITVTKLTSSSSQYTVGTTSPPLPAQLSAGQTIQVPLTFTPTQTGLIAATLSAETTGGSASFSVSGEGRASGAQLKSSPSIISYGGISTGTSSSGTATFSNAGNAPLTINAEKLPAAPFTVTGMPKVGSQIEPGKAVTVTVTFEPTAEGAYSGELGMETTGGNGTVRLSGNAGPPGVLKITSENNEFGEVPVGKSATRSFTVSNVGGTNVSISKSKPPAGGAFAAITTLSEGTTINAGETLTETVTFTPTAPGAASAVWTINGTDKSGLHEVKFSGTGLGTFGKTSVGASTDTFLADRKRVSRYTLASAGSVSKLSIYLAPTGTAGQQLLKGVLYSDAGGKPEALLGSTEQLIFKNTNSANWYDLVFPSPVKLAAGSYWIGVITGATSSVAGFRYDSVAASRDYNANTYTSGPTNPFGSVSTDAKQASLYATYAPTPTAVPVNTVPPTITGTPEQGQPLTEQNGSWTNEPTGYTYSWEQCNSEGNGCLPISGATEQKYVPVAGDVGHRLKVRETASNSAGPGSPAFSAATTEVTPPVPVNTQLPTITGEARQEQMLTEHSGAWANEPTKFAYQWLQCDASGGNCKPIGGATSQTYVLVAGDVGHTIKVQETATNATGPSSPATSVATAEVTPPVPTNTKLPTITGTAQQGQTLAEHNGSWTNEPTSFAYQWLQCNSLGEGCVPISKATAQTYVPVASDVGRTIEVQETAHNAGGWSGPATSAATTEVKPPVPANTSLPTITGTAQQGHLLTEHSGSWANEPTKFAYQWLQCDASGTNCKPIGGATSQTYEPVASDVGHTIKVQETATNAAGPSSPATSLATAEVVPPVPTNTSLPTITGTAQQGQTLTEHNASWTNEPTSFTYQWLQCNNLGEGCLPISKATAQTYVAVEADVGHTIEVQETAHNAGGPSIPATSNPTAPVSAPPPPSNLTSPTITGAAQQGQVLTAHNGSWTNEPTKFAYQWQRCDTTGAKCEPISAAVASTYTVASADVGSTLRVSVTASNSTGPSTPASSEHTAVVQQTPVTFGKTSVGASTDKFLADRKRVSRYALTIAGSVTKLSVYLAPTSTSGQQVLKGLIYADSSNAPGALLGTSEELIFKKTSAAGWYDLVFSSPAKLVAGNYWIGVITGATSNVAGFRYDSVAASRDYNTNTYTSGPTNPFGSVTVDAKQASLYATYTPG